MQGTAVVISPLISLMKDQVDAAKEKEDIIGSVLSGKDVFAVMAP